MSEIDPALLVPATFLRCHVGGGVSAPMRDALAKAEAWIVHTYPDRWDAIFKAVRSVGGYRPHGGKHSQGIAVDLDYTQNPYLATRTGIRLGGELAGQGFPEVREAAVDVCDRACAFAYGAGARADLSCRQPGETTEECWARLHRVSEALRAYLGTCWRSNAALVMRPPVPRAELAPVEVFEQVAADELFPATDALAGLAARGAQDPAAMRLQVLRDFEAVRVPTVIGAPSPSPRVTRNLAAGFLTIPQEVAVALCDVARMRWGAVDFGPLESGDIQHFDSPH